MNIFAIGDTHLSFDTDKPMDVFRGWSDYVPRLEKNWRNLVLIPGDISWAMSLEGVKKDFSFLDSLPGKKLMMKGNHDYWWNTKKKMDAFIKENGFDSLSILFNNAYRFGDTTICGSRGWFFDAENDSEKKVLLREAGRLRLSIEAGKKLGGEIIVFLHYPPVTVSQCCEEMMDVLRESGIKRCYYGHLHGASTKSAFTGEHDGIGFDLVSADHLGFCPKFIGKF